MRFVSVPVGSGRTSWGRPVRSPAPVAELPEPPTRRGPPFPRAMADDESHPLPLVNAPTRRPPVGFSCVPCMAGSQHSSRHMGLVQTFGWSRIVRFGALNVFVPDVPDQPRWTRHGRGYSPAAIRPLRTNDSEADMNLVLSPPLLGFVIGTRAALAFGLGLLVADRIPESRRRAVGLTLVAIGVAATIPAAMWSLAVVSHQSGRSAATPLGELERERTPASIRAVHQEKEEAMAMKAHRAVPHPARGARRS